MNILPDAYRIDVFLPRPVKKFFRREDDLLRYLDALPEGTEYDVYYSEKVAKYGQFAHLTGVKRCEGFCEKVLPESDFRRGNRVCEKCKGKKARIAKQRRENGAKKSQGDTPANT